MNDILKQLKKRRSVRKYKSDIPSKDIIDQIVEAGLYAASGRNSQATKIIVVNDENLRRRLSELNCRIGGWDEQFDPFYGAPVVLIVLADKTVPTHIYDGSLVMANLMIAAHSLGLGSCWIHRAKEEFETDFGRKLMDQLGISGDWEGIGHCVLGYPDAEPSKNTDRKQGRVFHL